MLCLQNVPFWTPYGTELAWLRKSNSNHAKRLGQGFMIYQSKDIRRGISLFFYYSFKNHHEAWCKDCFGYQNLVEFIVSQSACSHCVDCQDSVLPGSRSGISKRNRTPYQDLEEALEPDIPASEPAVSKSDTKVLNAHTKSTHHPQRRWPTGRSFISLLRRQFIR